MESTKEFLKTLRLKEAQLIGNLVLFPVEGDSSSLSLKTLKEALEEGSCSVKEKGKVNEAWVKNEADDEIFILEGEELLGAMQDRVSISSRVIPAYYEGPIPVVCVEKGRWSGKTSRFSSGFVAHPRLRSTISLSLKESLEKGKYKVDQKLVWREVKRKLTTLKVSSATESLHHSFDEVKDSLYELYSHWEPKDEIGVAAFTPKGLLCCDIFGSSELFKKEWPSLLMGYALDAWETRLSGQSGKLEIDKMKNIWEGIILTELKNKVVYDSTEEKFFEGEGLIGKGCIYKEQLVHIAFYPS